MNDRRETMARQKLDDLLKRYKVTVEPYPRPPEPSPVTRLLALLLIILALVRPATAHELRPAYLELAETAPGQFNVLWKVPAAGDRRLGLYLRLPAELPQHHRAREARSRMMPISSAGRSPATAGSRARRSPSTACAAR